MLMQISCFTGWMEPIKQKSLGQAIMVSDFVEEVGVLLECDGKKATFLLEHKTEQMIC